MTEITKTAQANGLTMFFAPEPLFVEVVVAAVAVPVLVLPAVVVVVALFPPPATLVETEECAVPGFAPAPFTNGAGVITLV
jgi:hypothetical protein